MRLTLTAALMTMLAAPAFAQDAAPAEAAPQMATAAATVVNTAGEELGTVLVADTPSGLLHATIELANIPEGPHAVHFHETGACTPDFNAAGGHLAMDHDHGVMHGTGPHPGDMPNLHAPADGKVKIEYFLPNVTVANILDDDGGAFIIHEGVDDYASQPTGEAGGRLGCGVFQAS